MRLERDLSKWVRKGATEAGGFCVKMHGSAFTLAGVPDMHITHPQWTGWIELKVGSNSLTKIQAARAREILRAGGRFVVLRLMSGGELRVDQADGTVVLAFSSSSPVSALLCALGKIA